MTETLAVAANLGPEFAQMNPETRETIMRSELVKFVPTYFHAEKRHKDAGEFHPANLCRKPGDRLTFSMTPQEVGGNPNFMDLGTGGPGAIWVVTESGNRYGIGNGIVYNHKEGTVYLLDQTSRQLNISVGKGAILPGVGRTSEVASVLIGGEISYGTNSWSWSGHNVQRAGLVNAIDPLIHVRAIGNAIKSRGNCADEVGYLRDELDRYPGTATYV